MHLVYFLQSGNKSYIGYTVDIRRRLRQHRGEIVGGAKYTSSWHHRKNLQLVAYISGFPTQKSALSYEWHAKRACARSLNFKKVAKTHRRLPGFFFPATTLKFCDVLPDLQVSLFKHHEIMPVLMNTFHLPQVRCEDHPL